MDSLPFSVISWYTECGGEVVEQRNRGLPKREKTLKDEDKNQAGCDLESTGEEKERKTQEHMAQRHRGRNSEKRSLLQGEDSPEPGALADCCQWNMLIMRQRAYVRQ